jgi:3-mercaptopyruvate sulfurtransferase SseA
LHRRGIQRVRPLAGGYTEWRQRGYPVEKVAETVTDDA